jgi:protein tyrosine phosphatase (PTP) superfamily phosphohydrolase (DUF442 family)
MDILNYVKVSDLIQTSGQPSSEAFANIRETGVETVINLSMPDHETAISNEGELVTTNGMNYIHIPVVWQSPKQTQLALFQSIMQAHQHKSIWVHCALNRRVSCFIYLYRTQYLGVPASVAKETLVSVWDPDATWSTFIANNS